jgi:hypothetical protein
MPDICNQNIIACDEKSRKYFFKSYQQHCSIIYIVYYESVQQDAKIQHISNLNLYYIISLTEVLEVWRDEKWYKLITPVGVREVIEILNEIQVHSLGSITDLTMYTFVMSRYSTCNLLLYFFLPPTAILCYRRMIGKRSLFALNLMIA